MGNRTMEARGGRIALRRASRRKWRWRRCFGVPARLRANRGSEGRQGSAQERGRNVARVLTLCHPRGKGGVGLGRGGGAGRTGVQWTRRPRGRRGDGRGDWGGEPAE